MADPDLDGSGSPDDCVASWCKDEKWCAVTCTMDVISNKWHPVIVRLLLRDGPLGFSALQERMGGVTGKVLSESLEALAEDGVVERRVVNERPRRVEYSLTPAGEALESVVEALDEWGDRYLSEEGFGATEATGDGTGEAASSGEASGASEAARVGGDDPDVERDEPLDGAAPGGRHAAAGPELEE